MPTARAPKTAMVVAQRIVADIHERGNRIGDRLPPESVMLEQYDVGRGTLRESLRFLELQGVIALKPGPGGGPVVRRPDSDAVATSLALLLQLEGTSLRSVAEARLELEPLLAGLAAQRATDEEIATLLALDAEEREFHRAVGRCAGHSVLGHLTDALLGLVPAPGLCGDGATRRDAHERIREAIAARDPDAATELMRHHLSAGHQRVGPLLQAAVRWGTPTP